VLCDGPGDRPERRWRLLGSNSAGIVGLCYATGAVTGEESVGGLLGSNSVGTGGALLQCYATAR